MPTLILAGGPAGTMPQERLQDMATTIPDCHPVTLGGGHRVHQVHAHQSAQQGRVVRDRDMTGLCFPRRRCRTP